MHRLVSPLPLWKIPLILFWLFWSKAQVKGVQAWNISVVLSRIVPLLMICRFAVPMHQYMICRWSMEEKFSCCLEKSPFLKASIPYNSIVPWHEALAVNIKVYFWNSHCVIKIINIYVDLHLTFWHSRNQSKLLLFSISSSVLRPILTSLLKECCFRSLLLVLHIHDAFLFVQSRCMCSSNWSIFKPTEAVITDFR